MKSKPGKTVRFAGHNCVVKAERYGVGGGTALCLSDAKTGEDVAVVTVNFPNVPLLPNQVFIKDYSENAGMMVALETAGIIRVTDEYVHTGIGELPICELLIPPPEPEPEARLEALSREPTADRLGEFAEDILARVRWGAPRFLVQAKWESASA